ncbi:MAG: hypothetical protein AAGB12_13430 [Pseudomonadota bacterium]
MSTTVGYQRMDSKKDEQQQKRSQTESPSWALSLDANNFLYGYQLSLMSAKHKPADESEHTASLNILKGLFYRSHPYAPNVSWYAGFRYYDVEFPDKTLSAFEIDESWLDWIIGGHVTWRFTEVFYVTGSLDVGTAIFDNHKSLFVKPAFFYEISEVVTISAEYELLVAHTTFDYEHKWEQHGPSISVSYTF